MNQELENFSYVQACLHWTHKALVEISFLNKERTPKEIELVNGSLFVFYRMTLHYMFTMEYIKLLEGVNNRYPKSHYGSLEKLSLAVYDMQDVDFKQKHEQNLKILSAIKETDLYIKVKNDRDKKFAHTDVDSSNPFTFHSFTDTEIEDAFRQLSMMKSVMDNCSGKFGFEFIFQHADNRTDNFIKFHTNYKEYYFANYFDAVSKGYH